jgi:hypothetical protein
VTFLRAPELFMPVFVVAVSAAAVMVFARRPHRGALAAVVSVLAVDMILWGHSSGWRQGSFAADFEFWGTQPATVTFFAQQAEADPEPFRIMTEERPFDPVYGMAKAPPGSRWVPALQADMHMPFGIENAAGYDGFGLSRYSTFAGDMKVWGELPDPDRVLLGSGREMDILNVRYLLARPMQGTPPMSSDRWRFVSRVGDVNVFENRRMLPRAWLASDVRVMTEAEILTTIRTGTLAGSQMPWEPAATVLVESAIGSTGAQPPDPAARADVMATSPNGLRVRTSSATPAVLVLAEHYFPGWKVRVDGASKEILRVNYDLRGVLLEPGEHDIEFVYRPAFVTAGIAVSGLTLALLVTWASRGRRSAASAMQEARRV